MAEFDLVVVGAGPGGYVSAIRASQLGLRVALVEKDQVGGLCLQWGCIPSKALLRGAELANLVKSAPAFGITYRDLALDIEPVVRRSRELVAQMTTNIETLLARNKVTIVRGAARLTSAHEVTVSPSGETLQAKDIIVATGAATRSLPGISIDGEAVITSKHALGSTRLPKSIVIIGGGAIGVELAYYFNSFGSQVTIVELLAHLLPEEDEDISRQLERSFTAQGIALQLGASVESVTRGENGVTVAVAGAENLTADQVLIAVGLAPNTEGLGLAELGVELANGWIQVDDYCQTTVPGVWAIGDVTGKLPLAHVAYHQGVTAVEKLAGRDPAPIDYTRMPRAVYCQPEVASLGLTERKARALGLDVRTGRFPFRANGKAIASNESEGFVKLVVDRSSDVIVGYHIIGHSATELLAEASISAASQTTANQLGEITFAHPTLSEAIREAALAVSGEAIHFFVPKRS